MPPATPNKDKKRREDNILTHNKALALAQRESFDFDKYTRDVRRAVEGLASIHIACVPILFGLKIPFIRQWSAGYRYSKRRPQRRGWPADKFAGFGAGAMTGPLSRNKDGGVLVVADFDSEEAIANAPHLMPETTMKCGRSRPTHWYYWAYNVPEAYLAPPDVGKGVGGPRKKKVDKCLDLLGAGAHACVPPCVWTDKDVTCFEHRYWYIGGEKFSGTEDDFRYDQLRPEKIEFLELFRAAQRVAEACGKALPDPPAARKKSAVTVPASLAGCEREAIAEPLPSLQSRLQPAAAYTPAQSQAIQFFTNAKIAVTAYDPAAGSGSAAGGILWQAARIAAHEFGLGRDECLVPLCFWNDRCPDPWPRQSLERVLDEVFAAGVDGPDKLGKPRGRRVKERSVRIHLPPGAKTVFIGQGVAEAFPRLTQGDSRPVKTGWLPGHTSPLLTPEDAESAGYVDCGRFMNHLYFRPRSGPRMLHPELWHLAWKHRTVYLCPGSNIASNQNVSEQFAVVAQLLQKAGASVWELWPDEAVPGRVTPFRDASAFTKVVPPLAGAMTRERCVSAHETAKEQESARKAALCLSRNKPSPGHEKAVAFITERGWTKVSKREVEEAKGAGIRERTLRYALKSLKEGGLFCCPENHDGG